MGILDVFKRKPAQNESNTLFGQTALGNNIVYQGNNKNATVNTQILYVTTASSTNAGRPVDTSLLTRNSTVMTCVGIKARPSTILKQSVKSPRRCCQHTSRIDFRNRVPALTNTGRPARIDAPAQAGS